MKNLVLFLALFLWSLNSFSQQILSVHGGYLHNIYNTTQVDDTHLLAQFDYKGGAVLGGELKYTNDRGVSNVFGLDYSLSAFDFRSEWEENNTWGNSDLSVHFNQLFVSYLMEYETGNRIQYFLSAGPALGWMVYNSMQGTIKEYEWYSTPDGPEAFERVWDGPGYANQQMSYGVLSVMARTGFTFRIDRDMSFKILAGIRADLNNNPQEKFDIAANRSLNQLIYLHFSAGITYDLGNVLKWETEE